MFLKSLESQLHSPLPPHPPPQPTSPSQSHTPPSSHHLPHHLCSLTVYNAIQGAHGLDGRPGPVVSGASPVPVTLLLFLLLLFLFHPPATACLMSAMSACLVHWLSCFPCLSCLVSFLRELCEDDCSGLGSRDALPFIDYLL